MNVLNKVTQPDSYLSQSGFKLVKPLGAGASGVVGLFDKDSRQYAIKIVDIDQLVENEQMHYLQETGKQLSRENAMIDIKKEVKNLQKISKYGPAICGPNFNFILTYEAFMDPYVPYYYLISEPMTDDLYGFFLSNKGCLDRECPEAIIQGLSQNRDELILAIICQLFYALRCLHQIGLVHGDLKPENIFIDGQTGKIKIADFGGSGWISQTNGKLDARDRQITASTLLYTPPERFKDPSIISPEVDVWALGVIILALSAQNPEVIVDILAQKPQTKINQIIEEEVKMASEVNEQWIKWLLRDLLNLDPNRRTDINKLLGDTRFSKMCNVPVDRVLKGTIGTGALAGTGFDLSDIRLKPLRITEKTTFSKKVGQMKKRLSPRRLIEQKNGRQKAKSNYI